MGKLTEPKDFIGHSGTPAITCSHKAASGFLYPLDKGVIFIYKPPIYIRYDECAKVEFERRGGKGRNFDINITTVHDIKYSFSSIEKVDYGTQKEQTMDHCLEEMKNEADQSGSSMSSDDEDFNPDALEALSAREEYDSEPDTTSSEDSDVSGSGSEVERKKEEKRKRKAEKKAASEKRAAKRACRRWRRREEIQVQE